MTTRTVFWAMALLAMLACTHAYADALGDCVATTEAVLSEAHVPTPFGNRTSAITMTAVYEAVDSITHRYPLRSADWPVPENASTDAAIDVACHDSLVALFPAQAPASDSALQVALKSIADGDSKQGGIAVGHAAARAVLARRADDGTSAAEAYRPATQPAVYVPTTLPLVPQWPMRRSWSLERNDQFRPGPPPDLKSELWERDYNEIKLLGAKLSAQRTAEQTETARFWETTGPRVYNSLLRSVTARPGREVTRNARLLAAAAQASDDALIAIFDAKYHYGFWRPLTAIRNGDTDGNDATAPDSSWLPLIDTPMHPEYPCAHCIVAAALGEIVRDDLKNDRAYELSGTSPTAPGVTRRYVSVDAMVADVGNGRVYDGVHFRHSTEVGADMGRRIGRQLLAKRANFESGQ